MEYIIILMFLLLIGVIISVKYLLRSVIESRNLDIDILEMQKEIIKLQLCKELDTNELAQKISIMEGDKDVIELYANNKKSFVKR